MNFLSVEELAQKLGVIPKTVKRWAKQGKIPVIRMSQRKIFFDEEAVAKAMREKSETAKK